MDIIKWGKTRSLSLNTHVRKTEEISDLDLQYDDMIYDNVLKMPNLKETVDLKKTLHLKETPEVDEDMECYV